jgi:hypothetical protein
VTFEAGSMTGRIERQLRIATDLGENAVPPVTVQATVEQGTVEKAAAEPAAGIGQSAAAK